MTTDPTAFAALGFFPADHAAAESGKVYASGAYWNTLRFPEFPAVLPSMTLVAVLRQPFHAADADHAFAIALEDADGRRQEFAVDGQFRAALGEGARLGEENIIPITVPVFGLGFEQPGDFSFVLLVDGVELARYSIHVVRVVG
ncbi:MAG: hypothetical protein ABIO67_05410 [Mycobacteriales bacterium]